MAEPVTLAFDTSSEVFSAGLYKKGRIYEFRENASLRHSDRMFRALAELLRRSKTSLQDLDLLVLGMGPGSFTGLRVGASVAKILSYGLGKPLLAFSTLEIMAQKHLSQKNAGSLVCVVQDAGRGNLYEGVFTSQGAVRAPRLVTIDAFIDHADPQWFYMGNGIPLCAVRLKKRFEDQPLKADGSPPEIRVALIFPRALERWRKEDFDDAFFFKPQYLYSRFCNIVGLSDAERKENAETA